MDRDPTLAQRRQPRPPGFDELDPVSEVRQSDCADEADVACADDGDRAAVRVGPLAESVPVRPGRPLSGQSVFGRRSSDVGATCRTRAARNRSTNRRPVLGNR